MTRPSTQPSLPGDNSPLSLQRGHLLAFGVLLFSLLVTFALWGYARGKEIRAAESEFAKSTGSVASAIGSRLENYEIVLKGGVALFASVEYPSSQQWRAYADGMGMGDRLPSMPGLGYSPYIPHSRLARLQAGHAIKVFPRGVRPHYGPVLFIEPHTPENVAAIGFDMYSNSSRHRAMSQAMESGATRMSAPVRLYGRPDDAPPGLLMYAPVYRGDSVPGSVEARREAMRGWVYAPFFVDHLVETVPGQASMLQRFSIEDISEAHPVPVYVSGAERAGGSAAFVHEHVLERFGRRWRMHFESLPAAQAIPNLRNLHIALALGILASVLLSAIVWSLVRTQRRAHKIANRMTEDFRRSEERFRAAIHYSAIGHALLDSDGGIVEANPALGRIVRLAPSSLVGVPLESLFEDEGPDLMKWLSRDGGDDGSVQRSTRRLHRAGGLSRHAQLSCVRIPGHVGQDVHGLVQVEDVTERIMAEARVHALNRTLEARVEARTRELSLANRELESFAYSISHDLRAPLRAIDGFSRAIAERHGDRLDETGRDYLARVRAATGRMAALIDALLTMSRLSRAELKPECVDLSQLANEIVEELMATETHPRLRVEVEPGLRTRGDSSLLHDLLANLIGNAIKFSAGRDAPHIAIGRQVGTDGQAEFFVRDNGAGFAQEYVDKLFRPFQRLHGQDEFAGHGIGLASVKRIVERHGGSIRAEGRVGEGATFWFTLPEEARAGDAA